MKHLYITLLCVLGITSCLGTHYFEPEVGETSETEDKISYLGDTCWFEIEYQQVLTKFQPGEAFKAFKYVVEIEGVESEEPTIVTKGDELDELTGKLKLEFPEFYEKWYEEHGGYPNYSRAIIAFAVPANMTEAERKVEVKVSIANDFRDTENWGEWETVFSAVQEGFEIEASEAGRILVDYECFVAGKDSETVSSLIGSDPLFMDNGIWKFIEYDIASPTGKIGIEVYDAKGDLLDTGSIMYFGNRCEEFPEVFSKILPNNQVVSQLLWEVNFENFGRRSFYVLIVKGEGPYGIFGPSHEVYLFEDITAEYKQEYDIYYAVKRHHLAYVLTDNGGNSEDTPVQEPEYIPSDIPTEEPAIDPYESLKMDISIDNAKDLCAGETANCYIVSEPGIYTLNPVKGNGEEILTNAASATILWETYGTDVAPNKGDLIVGICYKDNKVVFKTADNFKNGNAAVAVTDTEGHILWSWHIWMLDEKISEHTYANDAGVMMDRNLGATSAATGNIGSLGLYYQWGRKDPFVGYSVIDDCIDAKSSVNFPAHIKSSVETGTIEYAVSHPMTFIYGTGDFNSDWFYTGDNTVDNTRWSTSKTIYDPCPAGWKVPDGGQNGVWAKAFGDRVIEDITFDEINRGITVPSEYCSSQPWYPAAGRIFYRGSSYWYEDYVGLKGRYWTNTIDPTNQGLAFAFTFSTTERAFAYSGYTRHTAHTIRCQKIK